MTVEKANDIIKNPNRGKQPPPEPYEPEYRRLNRDPIVQGSVPMDVPNPHSFDSLNIQTKPIEDANFDFGSVDGIAIDEDGKEVVPAIDYIIDNNEFIDYMSYSPPPTTHQKAQASPPSVSTVPEINDYILMIKGKIIQTGELRGIESKVSAIVYGEDKDFLDVSVADIIVLKRVEIKVGVFVG